MAAVLIGFIILSGTCGIVNREKEGLRSLQFFFTFSLFFIFYFFP